MNSKNKNIRDLYRGINEFKRAYQQRNNLVTMICLRIPSNILNRLKNYFSQLLNVHNVSGRSQSEVDIFITNLKKYKSPGSDQIVAELIQAGGEILLSVIHKLINSACN
jgi:hypothetical protein